MSTRVSIVPGLFQFSSPGTFWTSLVPGPRDHGTFRVSRSRPVKCRDLPGMSRDVLGSPGKVPGPDRTGPRDLEGPVVPWSRGPGTSEVQKFWDLKIGKVLGQWKP